MVNKKNISPIHYSLFTSHRSRGFTLIELMVTVGIFAVITSVLLARNSKFDDETLLQSAAYEVALSVRQAQNYGINVRGQSGEFDNAYGVHFSENSPSYVLFRDLGDDPDNIYSGDTELLEEYVLGRGYTIARICQYGGASEPCGTILEGGGISVVFRRPEPEAIITTTIEDRAGQQISNVAIELVSPREGSRFIVVQQTGQIGVVRPKDDGGVSGEPVDEGGGTIELPPDGGATEL